MNLDLSEEQNMLCEMVRGVCGDHSPPEVVRRMEDDPTGYPADLWKALGELGLLGLTLEERYGGGGQSALECAIVQEELGRALAPTPYFVSAVLGAGVLVRAGSAAQKDAWLPKLCSGEAILTPAWLEAKRGYGPAGVQLRAVRAGDGVRLRGSKRHVAFASSAAALIVLARTGDAPEAVDLFLVDPQAAGVELRQQLTLASDTQYRVSFEDVQVPASARIGAKGSGWATWQAVMEEGAIMAAAQAVGGAERALELAVDYAKERKQFDKQLAEFQSISHYLSDAVTQVDGARVLVRQAAWACAMGRPIGRLAPMAKLFACRTFRDVTAVAQQIFGGVGFTLDYDIQLYFRRAKQLELSWWDSRALEERVASSVLDARGA